MRGIPLILHWRHNGRDGVSNHQPHHCLLNRLFKRISKKTSKLRVTGLCAGNSPVAGEFPPQRASNAENVSIWWRHHVQMVSNAENVPCHDVTITPYRAICFICLFIISKVFSITEKPNEIIFREISTFQKLNINTKPVTVDCDHRCDIYQSHAKFSIDLHKSKDGL